MTIEFTPVEKDIIEAFQQGDLDMDDIDQDLLYKLFDYFFLRGDMPYEIAKARSGDPMNWICDNIHLF